MVRRLALFLVLLLSLQWSSSAIAAMCMHEGDAEVSHLGHHAHSHDSAADEGAAQVASLEAGVPDPSGTLPDGDLEFHADCAGCHLTASPVLPAASTPDHLPPSSAPLLPALSARLSSWASESPFRPPRT